jgi:hypothetical protein
MKLFKAFIETNLAIYLVGVWVTATVVYIAFNNL